MTEQRCRTCEHWSTHWRDDTWGYCDMADYSGAREDARGRKHTESLAVAHDASDFGASLVTAPDFGCIQWRAKP